MLTPWLQYTEETHGMSKDNGNYPQGKIIFYDFSVRCYGWDILVYVRAITAIRE